MTETLLQVTNVSKMFGGLMALDGVDVSIKTGLVSAVIGPNGAGKTTLFNLITGVYPFSDGDITFQGVSLKKVPAHTRTKMGIARTFQNVLLFPHMTVIENVMVGQHSRSSYGFFEAAIKLPRSRKEEDRIKFRAMKYLNLAGLGLKADQDALSLPLGQQKLLAIARALATEPSLLLLDEPGAGLNKLEKMELSDLIRRIKEMGISVVLVEHDMDLVMGIADWIFVLDSGRKIAEGTAAEIQRDPKVISAYLGEEIEYVEG